VSSLSAVAQSPSNEWTYQFGYQGGTTSAAYFGTKGVASGLDNPGAREGGVTWTDASGNLWMFGGYGDSSGYIGYLNDIWTWNVTTRQWTWVGGDGGVPPPYYANAGVYGTQGVATAMNLPGGRVAAEHWVDSTGKVWMFGGQGADSQGTVGDLNDLWRYDPATQQWTWIGGATTIPGLLASNPAVYGTLGVAAAANTPGGRDGATTWIDALGNLWLFGGETYSAVYNDLWMYSPGTGEWTWEGGSQTGGSAGTAGIAGIASAVAMPSARVGGFGWVDQQHNFWLFGGKNSSAYNDLWEFNPTTSQWTYWSGSNTSATTTGSYGTLGVASASNQPAGRAFGSAWTDANGNLWMFGGTQLQLNNNLNDLWLYQPASNEWTWIGGSSMVQAGGTYGPQGTPTATAYPGARDAQLSWVDGRGNFWVFGGWNSEPFDYQTAQATPTYWDDLWEYAVPAIKTPAVTVSPLALSLRTIAGMQSTPQTVTLTNNGTSSVAIADATVSGANASDYQLTNNCGAALAAGASCTVAVILDSPTPASLPATLVITDSDSSSPQSVVLDGDVLTATTTSLNGSSASVTTDASDTLTVTVTPTSGTGIPTGAVVLQSGGVTVATLTLGAAGSATYTINQPAIGVKTYTAQYSGDLNYGGSTSSAFTVTSIANPTTTAPAWVWLKGTSGVVSAPVPISAQPADPAGVGVGSSNNYPGIRYDSLTWADTNGDLYLFGGLDFDDLWKYNIASGAWTLLKGSYNLGATLPSSVFGTKGTAEAASMPGSRTYASRWIDASGNLWLFGGTGPDANGNFGPLNDLWMYSPATNNWTWMGGDQTLGSNYGQGGVYGTSGVAAATNKPGGRSEATTWVDKNGNLWLFGGVGMDASDTQNYLNDLWMYNVSTNQWTWEAGTTLGTNNGDVFITQGLASVGNTPSARVGAMSWSDSSGRLWLFGGSGYGVVTTSSGELNDVWMFDPSANLWTWVGGTLTLNGAGTYGTQGTGSSNNLPPARQWGATFTDESGNFWLFGGTQTSYVNNTATVTPFSDLWTYSPTTNLWTWVAGSNTPISAGNYGTEGTPSAANIPSARLLSAAWSDASGNFWLLGGTNGYPYSASFAAFDDLWKATPVAAMTGAAAVTLSPAGPLSFTTPSGTSSAMQTVTLTNTGTAPLTGITIGISNGLGAFSESDNCPSSLAAGGTCTLTLGFTPAAVANYTGSVMISDNASNSPQSISLTGTGTGTLAPIATIYPAALTFNPTMVNTTNSGQSITIANSGTAALTGITASIIGANASNFAISSDTCSSLTLGSTCTISVTFTPTTTGPFNATLSIADNAGNSPQAVPLSGTGATSSELASITPSFLAFANQTVNTTSEAVLVTLSSIGSTALTNISPAITGPGASAFAVSSSTCTASLPAAANCSLLITFTPSSTATFNATLTVTNDAGNSPQVVPLSGTGTAATTTSVATLSTSSLTFPNTAIGSSSPLAVTVTNAGSQALSIEGITFGEAGATGATSQSAALNVFTQTSTCGATLAAGASCVITVTFTPTAGVAYQGTLLIADNSSSLAQSVLLTGVGTGGSGTSAVLSPYFGLNLGTVAVNSTSAPMTATLTNTGSATLTGITPSLSGGAASGFAISTTTCGSSLPAGGTCTISVTLSPAFAAPYYTAGLSVADSASSSPQSITLQGNSFCSNVPDTNCNPGGQTVVTNTTSFALAFQPATVTAVTATAASTEIIGKYQGTVVYDQTFPAAYGTPTVQSGVTAANAAIAAAGGPGAVIPAPALISSSNTTGTASTSVYSPNPAAPVFATGTTTTFGPATIRAVAGGEDGPALNPTVDLLNECNEISLPSTTMPTCYATDPGLFQVESGQTDLNIATTVTYFIDVVTTTTTTTTTATTYSINGTAATTAPAVSLIPAGPLSFSANAGATSAAQTVTITNSGTASLSLTGISITGANASTFSETNNCGSTLAEGATCSVSIIFSPSATGSDSAVLSVADNASGSPQTVALNGTANPAPAPVVSLLPSTALSFSATAGTTSAVQTVTVTNTGNTSLSITGITIGGANSSSFAESNTCGSTLAASSSCTVSITFSPATAASYMATLSIADNATGSPQTVSLTGTATAPAVAAVTLTPPGPLVFTANSGATSAAQIVTLTNSGTAALSVTGISLTGTNASAFAESNTCGSSLALGAGCAINVTFSPTSAGSFTALLTVADNAGGSPQTVVLNGTGTGTVPVTFTLNASGSPQIAQAGGVATYVITASAQNGAFPGSISLSTSGVPPGVTATFTPQSITPGNGSATSQLTLAVPASFAALHPPQQSPGWMYACILPMMGLGLVGIRRRRKLTTLLMLLIMTGAFALTGCGAGFGKAAPQTYTITITAASTTQTATTTVTLTVQ
jgi:N-acetylneuraminic acid mutarotase